MRSSSYYADPELAEVVENRSAGGTTPLNLAAVYAVKAWDDLRPERAIPDPLTHYGFLVLEGPLAVEVEVLVRRCLELVGPGDVVRPLCGMATAPFASRRRMEGAGAQPFGRA